MALDLTKLPGVSQLIDLALDEDLGRGDVTTESVLFGARHHHGPALALIVAREPLVVYGLDVCRAVFGRVDASVEVTPEVADGARVAARHTIVQLRGPADSILMAERTALNFMQRLSGVATLSARFAEAVAGTDARVVDTRKTTPGYRALQKAAVLAGGCGNHRFDLGAGVLIKDNHIAAVGSLTEAVERARARAPHSLRIEVEVTTADQLEEAIAAGADVVLLDNMTLDELTACAARAHEAGLLVEASGGITLDTIGDVARTGVDLISTGALTHSAPSVDIALDFQ